MEYVIIWLVCAVVGGVIGDAKGNFLNGFLVSVLLGPLGVLIAAVLPRSAAKQAQYERRVREAAERLGQSR